MRKIQISEHDLIAQIEAFAAARGIAPATVTSRAVGNSRLYTRLVNGGGCSLRIAGKLIAYIGQYDATLETT
jgi:hypothetical protein